VDNPVADLAVAIQPIRRHRAGIAGRVMGMHVLTVPPLGECDRAAASPRRLKHDCAAPLRLTIAHNVRTCGDQPLGGGDETRPGGLAAGPRMRTMPSVSRPVSATSSSGTDH
jgi:hypothetical protein